MTGRLALGAVVGGVVLFLWGFIFWTVLPFGHWSVSALPDEQAVIETLREVETPSGAYYFPAPPEESDTTDPEYVQKHSRGPIGHLFYRAEGIDPNSPWTLMQGFFHFLLSALLVVLLMKPALPQLGSYGLRVGYIWLLGLFATFSVQLSYLIWWHHPGGFHFVYFIFHLSAWLLAGLAMAVVVKPQ